MGDDGQDAAKWLADGWGGVDAPTAVSEADQEQAAEEEHRVNTAIHRTFKSGTGAIVLEWLRGRTIEQPTFNPALVHPAEQGFTREGQNSIVREIERRMRVAEDGPPTARTKGTGK